MNFGKLEVDCKVDDRLNETVRSLSEYALIPIDIPGSSLKHLLTVQKSESRHAPASFLQNIFPNIFCTLFQIALGVSLG